MGCVFLFTVYSLQKNKPHKAQTGEGKREMGEK